MTDLTEEEVAFLVKFHNAFYPVVVGILQDRDDARNSVDALAQVWASRLGRAMAKVSPQEEPF